MTLSLSFYYHYFIKKKRFGVFKDYVDKKRKRIAFLIEYVDTKNDQIQFKVVKSLVSTTSILVSNGNILISVLLSLLIYIYQSHTYLFHVCCCVTTFNAHKWVFVLLTRPQKVHIHTRIYLHSPSYMKMKAWICVSWECCTITKIIPKSSN